MRGLAVEKKFRSEVGGSGVNDYRHGSFDDFNRVDFIFLLYNIKIPITLYTDLDLMISR